MTASTTGGKKRGRKKKDGTESVVSGGRTEAADGRSNTGKPDEGDDAEDDEDEDPGGEDMVDGGGEVDQAAERKKLAYVIRNGLGNQG